MLPTITLICTLFLAGKPAVESVCEQVVPANEIWVRSPERTRAVMLIHGFHYHFRNSSVPKAEFRPWQNKDSALVKELGKSADVFVFAYGQDVTLDTIVEKSKLGDSIAKMRKLGYREIVLLGHSAGGLIARQFVEDHPDAGVTKVIQVCAPNGGSPLATLTAPKSQKIFLRCLTAEHRKKCLEKRKDLRIPAEVQFACVVARLGKDASSDGVVPCAAQWTPDLQKQGIPAVSIVGSHRQAVRDRDLVETLADLVQERLPRWSAERVEKARREIIPNK